MRHVSIAELKDHAEEIIAAAQAGEQIAICAEGRDVVRLTAAYPASLLEDNRTHEQRQAQREAVEALAALGREIYARNGPTTAAEVKAWIEDEKE